MTRDELIRAVALRMDEITPDSDYIIPVDGSDNNPLYALIDGLIEDGMLELFSVAPYWRLPQTAFGTTAEVQIQAIFKNTPYERQMLRLKLPEAFLRVAEINHTSFSRPITEVVGEQSEEGKRQHNPYLVGKTAKPVGVMSHGVWVVGKESSQCREIDCYSLPKDATLTATDLAASYIAKPKIIDATATNAVESVVPSVLIPALEWLVAARAFGVRGDANHAAVCQQNAQNLIV